MRVVATLSNKTMCVVATLSKKTMCVVAALMEWLTWSKSCLPVVLVWMANSSSASMVVTRTLYCKIIHTHLVRIIKLMVYVLHDYNYITWYLISQWKQIQRKLFEVHHFSCEENPTFCLPASIKHFNFFFRNTDFVRLLCLRTLSLHIITNSCLQAGLSLVKWGKAIYLHI